MHGRVPRRDVLLNKVAQIVQANPSIMSVSEPLHEVLQRAGHATSAGLLPAQGCYQRRRAKLSPTLLQAALPPSSPSPPQRGFAPQCYLVHAGLCRFADRDTLSRRQRVQHIDEGD